MTNRVVRPTTDNSDSAHLRRHAKCFNLAMVFMNCGATTRRRSVTNGIAHRRSLRPSALTVNRMRSRHSRHSRGTRSQEGTGLAKAMSRRRPLATRSTGTRLQDGTGMAKAKSRRRPLATRSTGTGTRPSTRPRRHSRGTRPQEGTGMAKAKSRRRPLATRSTMVTAVVDRFREPAAAAAWQGG